MPSFCQPILTHFEFPLSVQFALIFFSFQAIAGFLVWDRTPPLEYEIYPIDISFEPPVCFLLVSNSFSKFYVVCQIKLKGKSVYFTLIGNQSVHLV